MFTIVIGDGLTNEFLSPEIQFQAYSLHVGLQEIDRLLGSGQDFGTGPLPTFLREAVAANGRRFSLMSISWKCPLRVTSGRRSSDCKWSAIAPGADIGPRYVCFRG